MKKNLAIIPARGGSKGIINKNTKSFCGQPLIYWTINLAKKIKEIDRVIVSTDSEKISNLSKKFGAEVPFSRPRKLAGSKTSVEEVLNHAYLNLLETEGYKPDSIVLLFPTNPLRKKEHIQKSIKKFYSESCSSVITVNESPAHYTPYWTIKEDSTKKAIYFNGNDLRKGFKQRQEFPDKCYAKNDLVFVIEPNNLIEKEINLYGPNPKILKTEKIFDGDINNQDDWDSTLLKFKQLNLNNN